MDGRSALGTVLARYRIASRSVVSMVPSGSTMGSSNRVDQPPLLAICLEPLRQARRLLDGSGVTARARRTGSATGACMWSVPWLIRMVLADPAGVVAAEALHDGSHDEHNQS